MSPGGFAVLMRSAVCAIAHLLVAASPERAKGRAIREMLIGAVYSRSVSGRVREIIYRKHRIFYRIREEVKLVEGLSVWHGSREEPELPA